MKKLLLLFSAIFFLLSQANSQDAKEIVQESYDLLNGSSSKGKIKMEIIRPSWSRTIEMKSWSLGMDYSMVLITAPAKEKGQVYLKRENEMWNWIPKIGRMIKLPPSMMMQSWMGSDFKNDDFIKQSSIVDDYTHKIVSRDKYYDHDCYILEMTPKPDAPVVWGKIKTWIAVDEKYTLRNEYYDEDGNLINKETLTEIEMMDGRKIPTKYTVVPSDKKGHKTIMKIISYDFNPGISKDFFSQQQMKRVK